ncbi:MAG: hypothetical protein ABEJ61_08130 [Haloferacaceae archaeon]
MADVSGRDRGQLFLVGALVIATLLVVLALFLNSGIYAQNVAARNADPGVTGAVEYRRAAVDATAGTMTRLNREDPENNDNDDLEARMAAWSNGTAVHGAYRGKGRAVTVSEASGTLIGQNATRRFTNATNSSVDWYLVDDTGGDGTGGIRDYRMNVSQTDTLDISGFNATELEDNAFHARIEGSGGTYDVYVGTNATGATEAINVTVDDGTPASCEEPFGADGRASVNLTNASVAGARCSALADLADASPDYTIEYRNPMAINGTYELIVLDGGTIPSNNFNDDPDDGSPWTADAVYSANVTVFYRARSVTYGTTVEVVPGEELS